jgi:hypothetical protein
LRAEERRVVVFRQEGDGLAGFSRGGVGREGLDLHVVHPVVGVGAAGAGAEGDPGVGQGGESALDVVDDADSLEVHVEGAVGVEVDAHGDELGAGVKAQGLAGGRVVDERIGRGAAAFAFARQGLEGDDRPADFHVHGRRLVGAAVVPGVKGHDDSGAQRGAFFGGHGEGQGRLHFADGDAHAVSRAAGGAIGQGGAAAGAASDAELEADGEAVDHRRQGRAEEAAL